MEFDPVEMMAFCIALLDHLVTSGASVPGLDEGAAAAALSDLTEGMAVLGVDETLAEPEIDALRPVVGAMPAADLEEGAAFCSEMARDL